MKRGLLVIPYIVFLVLFVLMPMIIILIAGFTDSDWNFSLSNAVTFFTSKKMLGTLVYSLFIGIATTLICLIIAFPTAYILAKGEYCKKHAFLLLFIVPMWINFTLRITALKEILTFFEGNIALYPELNTIIGMVYDFLPFMIMPVFNAISNIDNGYLEAASDLGAKPFKVISKIVLPLAVPGIISGVTMILLSSMTNYVVLDMVYNSTYIMGSLIGSFFSTYNWSMGSFVSLVLLVFIGVLSFGIGKLDRTGGRAVR